MDTPPSRGFKAGKLRFISRLVRESLFARMAGSHHLPLPAAPGELGVTWIGHSSFLLQLAGTNILIDPVFSNFLLVLKRRRRPGVRLRDLPSIGLVLLTHAHMDHLDLPSLRGVLRRQRRRGAPAPLVVVPRGVEDLVADLPFREIRVLEPYASTLAGRVEIIMTPARHWGARLFSDTWRGYGGYVLRADGHSVHHCGDSAYFPGFAEIGRRLSPEIALLPIGAYSPASFRSVHTSPEDAWQAFQDLRSRTMIPMHYGTFRLSAEPMDEPPRRLLAAAQEAGMADRLLLLQEGSTHLFPAQP